MRAYQCAHVLIASDADYGGNSSAALALPFTLLPQCALLRIVDEGVITPSPRVFAAMSSRNVEHRKS